MCVMYSATKNSEDCVCCMYTETCPRIGPGMSWYYVERYRGLGPIPQYRAWYELALCREVPRPGAHVLPRVLRSGPLHAAGHHLVHQE